MKWLDDPPESWERAPDDPPAADERTVGTESYSNGIMVHDAETETPGAFIYAWEGEVSLDDAT